MADNFEQWDRWKNAEDSRSSILNIDELLYFGYFAYIQSNYRLSADYYHQVAEYADQIGDIDLRCHSLLWEGYCYNLLCDIKKALSLLLFAEQLNGGTQDDRFNIVSELFDVSNKIPLPKERQLELLGKLTPYKTTSRLGDSRSIVLQWEGILFSQCGEFQDALNCAQEAIINHRVEMPAYNDCYYYRALVKQYCNNNLIDKAWDTLQIWRDKGETSFTKTKSWQLRAEAQILYLEKELSLAWDTIQYCQSEEKYLKIYGVEDTETLIWLIRIAVDLRKFNDAKAILPTLFRFHNSDSLYFKYDCFYWFTYYYAGLSRFLRTGGISESRYETEDNVQKRKMKWYMRAKTIGLELDQLMETDLRRKELDDLKTKF